MSLASSSTWLTSLSCAFPEKQTSGYTFVSTLLQWFEFIFLSPCPQRAILSFIDVVLLFFLFVFAVTKFWKRSTNLNEPLIRNNNNISIFLTTWFKLTLTVAILLTLVYTVASVLAFSSSSEVPWNQVDEVFWLVQTITHAVLVVLIIHEKRFEAVKHPLLVRLYWIANFFVISLFAVSAVIRLVSVDVDGTINFKVNDVVSFISLPLSLFLLFVAVKGSTGIVIPTEETRPLLEEETKLYDGGDETESEVTGFASASILSKAFWSWINPLLRKGYKSALKIDEIPTLSPEHRAERMSSIFESKWPKSNERSKHPVRITLLRCFWKELAFNAFLAIIRLCVMFVGPVLIQSFVDFTSGKRSSEYEGYYLVLILLVSKFIEVLATHHLNFQAQKLGTLLRSTLIPSLYKKGLMLSFSARQDHGIGTIVNYMAVDTQQLSDMMLQFNAVWIMPFQVAIGMFLLYNCLGASSVTAFLGLLGVFVFAVIGTRRNNHFQYNVMRNRDSRMKAVNEMLNYMRVIKFQAWEEHFSQRIMGFRETEYGWLSKLMFTICGNIVVMWSTPLLVSTITFGTAILLGVQLDAATVFTTTTVFKILQEPIRTFPQSMISLSQAFISLERLDRFMLSRELLGDSVEREEGCGGKTAVEIIDGTFSWDDDNMQQDLKNVNLEIKKGELTAIVGTVGSGKSSLLASILGEMRKISGKVRVCGNVAYVAQTSWIQNGTIEENILFGLPMDRRRYNEVIRVCCLEKDLEMMDYGDQTEIGERGINLSGGQKQRIQLARAVYQDCDIYLLDDVFSAVDAHTGSEIFKECVRGALKGKTIILVTHQVDFLHNVDQILVTRDGMIVQSGKYDELLDSGMDFKALVVAHETSMALVEQGQGVVMPGENLNKPMKSPEARNSGESNSLDRPVSSKKSSKLIKEEERETGKVSLHIYKLYCTEAFGWWGITVVLIFSLLWQASMMASDYWLAYETSEERAKMFNPSLFISIYAIITAVSIILVVIRSYIFTLLGLKTAQIFFTQILRSILRAPMSFFDTTPSGRILSRMVSVERIKQFTNIPSEPAWNIKDRMPPSNWPSQGNVDIKDLQKSRISNVPLDMSALGLGFILYTCESQVEAYSPYAPNKGRDFFSIQFYDYECLISNGAEQEGSS
ncbi:hypothetical protein JHK84_054149 [Glycine max]|nr:hypothetical protein JHK84_054149 [Glycine max]